ncbi:hypothetical protein Ciccas_009984 [Cichlidogyrus casuarinus]|uniref:Uncharacterized protein n=1 Tax=Cichlidogyrus casuarinus TaxID=1844966 RepID=A0ABD2PX03_9PLAT
MRSDLLLRKRAQNDIPALKKQWRSIINNPKAFAHVKNTTQALLVRNNGCLDNYILSSDGCELELTAPKLDRFSDISTSLLYYARSIKQIKSWTQIARQFFPNSHHSTQPRRLTDRWCRLIKNQELFQKTKKYTEDLLEQHEGTLDNYILSACGSELEARERPYKTEEAPMCQKYRLFSNLENCVLFYACVWKNMTGWRDIEQQFFPKSTRPNVSVLLPHRWRRIKNSETLFRAIKKSTATLVRKHGGSLEQFVLSPDGSKLVVCKEKPPTRPIYRPDKTKSLILYTSMEDNFIFYARVIKKMSTWMEISKQFFPKRNRNHRGLNARWLLIKKRPNQLEALRKSTEKLIEQHGGSLDKFTLSPDGSDVVLREEIASTTL